MIEAGGTLADPRVRVRIEVETDETEKPRPKLLKSTKGHEVFEVDGFVFKKRRKVAELSLQAEDCGGNADGDTAIRGRALTSEQAELKKRAEPDNLTQDQQQQAAAASLQQRNLGRVLEACEAACTVALEDCSSSTSARGGPDPEAVTSVVDAALKAWLKTMHEQLPKHFQSTEGSKPSSGVAVNQVPAVAAEQRPKAPVAVEEVEVDVETSKSMLRTMLARLEAEEAQWLQLQERLPGLPQAPSDSSSMWTAMDDAFTSKMETQAACKQLEEAHKAAHCRLVLQVEHYVGMVSAMEELMDKAEQSCSSMQAEYHKEKFRAFPHVDSPASLIKGLAQRGTAA